MRQHDEVVPPQPSLRPRRVGLNVLPQRVTCGACLLDGVDALGWLTGPCLQPRVAVVPHLAALNLEAGDAGAVDGDDEIDLVLLVVVGDALTGDEEIVVEELVAQQGPDLLFGGGSEAGWVGDQVWHVLAPLLPVLCVLGGASLIAWKIS